MMAATAVVLASGLSVFFFGMADGLNSNPPMIGQTTGEFQPQDDQSGYIVRLQHVSGDTVAISQLEIAVDAQDACGQRGRIVNVPTQRLSPENIDGADIFSPDSPTAGELQAAGDGEWESGENLQFQVDSNRCQITAGESVTVRVVHTESNAVISTTVLTAD